MKAVIGIDPGHGGSSSGTYSVNTTKDGLFEKDFALELSLMIEERLLKNGFGAVLSRRTDVNPGTVVQRAEKMIENKVDFALSLHFNGFGTESANGTEVYVPYEEKVAGIEARMREVLLEYFKERKPFARSNDFYNRNRIFDKKLNVETRKFDAVSDDTDYFGFIRTCWAGGVSADLLEICFLTNPADFKTYMENKEKIAEGIAKAIVEAFGEKYSEEEVMETPKAVPRIKRKFDVLN